MLIKVLIYIWIKIETSSYKFTDKTWKVHEIKHMCPTLAENEQSNFLCQHVYSEQLKFHAMQIKLAINQRNKNY